MRSKYAAFLLYLLLFGLSGPLSAQTTMKVATYNLKYDEVRDTVNGWKTRAPFVAGLVQFHDFDLFGTQEGLYHQLKDLQTRLPQYAFTGKGRDDGQQAGEFSAIVYKAEKYALLQHGDFWLSQTPDRPGKGWDAAYPRIGSWGQFRDRASGFVFYLFNIHFDNRGEVARQESAKLVLRKIKELAGKSPVILTGDFNLNQLQPVYQQLTASGQLRDAYVAAALRYAPSGTFNGFQAPHITPDRIDHIFLSPQFRVQRYGILTDTYGKGKFPSDHFPVSTVLSVQK